MAFTFATLEKFKTWWKKPPKGAFTGAVKWEDGEHVGSGSFGDVRKFRIAVLGEKEAWIVVKKLKSAELDVGPLNANLAKEEHQVVLPTLTVGKHTFPPVYRSARCLDKYGKEKECIVCFMGEHFVFENKELMTVLHNKAETKDVQKTQMNAINSLLWLCQKCLSLGIAVPDFKLKNIGYIKTQSSAGVAVFDVRLLDLEGLIFTKNCFETGKDVIIEYTYVAPFKGTLTKADYGIAEGDAMADQPATQLLYLTTALMFLAALGIANRITMDQMAVFIWNKVTKATGDADASTQYTTALRKLEEPGQRCVELHKEVEDQYNEVIKDENAVNYYIHTPLTAFYGSFYLLYHSDVESAEVQKAIKVDSSGARHHPKYVESGKSLIAAFAAFTDKTLFFK